MKIIEACLKLYYDKDHHTHGNTDSQACDVDNSVIPGSDQTSECGKEIIFQHKQVVLSFKITFPPKVNVAERLIKKKYKYRQILSTESKFLYMGILQSIILQQLLFEPGMLGKFAALPRDKTA